jgi:two-component system, LytTR family, response regulator
LNKKLAQVKKFEPFEPGDEKLKPFEFERFLVAVNKVKTAQKEKQVSGETSGIKDYLYLNVQKKKVKILFSGIVYIESQREYIKIVTTKKEWISKMTTHEMEDLLPANLFKRIYRSFIVSLSKIQSYTVEEVEVNGIVIPIGRDYRDVIKDL